MPNKLRQDSPISRNLSPGRRRHSNTSSKTSGLQALSLDVGTTTAAAPPSLLTVQEPSPNPAYRPTIFPPYDTRILHSQGSSSGDLYGPVTTIRERSQTEGGQTFAELGLWPSQTLQTSQGSNNQLRRSQSQPFVANTEPRFWGQSNQQQQIDMRCVVFSCRNHDSPIDEVRSTSTQTLPSPFTHLGHGQDYFSSPSYSALSGRVDGYHHVRKADWPHSGYGGMSTLPHQSYMSSMGDGRIANLSPRILPSTPAYGHNPSRLTENSSRSPPFRERTPIRHHRPGVSRARSSSRPDILLSYATEQRQQRQAPQILPSQSVPSTPPSYSPSAFIMPATTAALPSHSAYYGGPFMSQSAENYLSAHSAYPNDPNQPSHYGLTRTFSHPVTLDVSTLNPQDALYLPNPIPSNSPSLPPLGPSLPAFPHPPNSLESTPEGFRVLTSRPKPQCFDHGCNGRQFSTFSNLLRHQREKSGSAMKAVCPHCGTEFTRTTARNGHLWGGKCKGRSGEGQSGSGPGLPSSTSPE